jgi:hypothetical protein
VKFADVPRPLESECEFWRQRRLARYDRDGKVDLFVATTYMDSGRPVVLARWRHESYCTPESPARGRAVSQSGRRTFEDITVAAGVGDPPKSLGVTVLSSNGDSWPDLFVANDTQPNKLYRNTGKAASWKAEWRRAWPMANGVARRVSADAGDYDGSRRTYWSETSQPDAGALSQRRQRTLWTNPRHPRWVAPAFCRSPSEHFSSIMIGRLSRYLCRERTQEEIGRVNPK